MKRKGSTPLAHKGNANISYTEIRSHPAQKDSHKENKLQSHWWGCAGSGENVN